MDKRENSGILFTNDRKENERHPDYKGNINIDGKEFWLSGWKKTGARGPFISLAIKPKEGGPSRVEKPAAKPADDDPFF
jgi:hypothetical protein